MTTARLYQSLLSLGITFTKEQDHKHDIPVWKARLENEVVGVSKWKGELIRFVGKSLGED